jgi:hypothetical protein
MFVMDGLHYIVMERLGSNLLDIKEIIGPLHKKCIAQIAIYTISQL